MKDNFFKDDYVPYNQVYQHESGFRVFLGDITAAVDQIIIQKQQIGCVITAAAAMDHVNFDQSVNHIRFNVLDSKSENLSNLFQHFYQLMEKELKRTNILVHCFAGVSRSATLVISYLMKKYKWNFKQAIAEVRKYRPSVLPNLGFERQLKQYEKVIFSFEISERKYISKTSESKKHIVKQKNLGLPELFGNKSALTKSKMIESNFEGRKIASSGYEQHKINNNLSSRGPQRAQIFSLAQTQVLSNKLIPIKSIRKRTISMNKNPKKTEQLNVYSRHGYRKDLGTIFGSQLKINDTKLGLEKKPRHNKQYDIKF